MTVTRTETGAHGTGGTGRRCLGRRCLYASMLTLLAAVFLWVAFGPSVGSIDAYASDIHSYGERPPTETRRAQQGFPAHDQDELFERVTYELEAPGEGEIAGKRSGDVEASSLLRTYARVYDEFGDPMKGARVVFVWRTEDSEHRVSRTTDARGTAMAARWIGADERGRQTVLVVLVDTPGWSDSDYTWFVPE